MCHIVFIILANLCR